MAAEMLIVFTAKSVEWCLEVGGTQSWALDPKRARHCDYAVLCQNRTTEWGDGKEPHRTAFMIGHIVDVVPSTETDGRWLVKFDKYARINIPDYWEGLHNPVRYRKLDELPLSISDLTFEPMPEISNHPETAKPKLPAKLTMDDAKKGLAATFGVKPDAVEIIIHG